MDVCPLIRGVGSHCVIGHRPAMEDRFYGTSTGGPFFGVYDGHGGDAASDFLVFNLHNIIHHRINLSFDAPADRILFESIRSADRQFMTRNRMNGKARHGSTVITSIVQTACSESSSRCTNHVTVGNLGDSRAIIASRQGKVMLATDDHKPNNPEEKRRIQKHGGFVSMNRVMGNLALSRAIGDEPYKVRNFVIADSDIYELSCNVKMNKEGWGCGDYLVLASDGLWDVYRNAEIAKIVAAAGSHNLNKTAEDLVVSAIHRGSTDNVCVVIVAL
jgi:serine/threonine protein phosphatase PrpC